MIKKNNLIPCDLCGANDFLFLFSGRDYLSFSPLAFNVMKCNNCGLICLNPYPDNIVRYYDAYRKNFSEKDVFFFQFLLPDRAGIIKKIKKTGKVLDIGCGTGGFLLEMQNSSWEVYGCDFSADACNISRNAAGLRNIYNGDILNLNFPKKYFDVVTLWHVLEHLTSPKDVLKKIHDILKDDGVLIVESPNFSSIQSRFFKSKWFSLDLPRHIHQLTPKTVGKLLNSVNLEIFKRDYIVNPYLNFVGLKQSILRHLTISKYSTTEPEKSPNVDISHEANVMWRFSRFMFNCVSLALSLFLVLFHCEDSFRVYCKKAK